MWYFMTIHNKKVFGQQKFYEVEHHLIQVIKTK